MTAGTDKFGEGVVADLYDLVKGDVPPDVAEVLAVLMAAAAPLMRGLAGGETMVQIAGPYVADLLELGKVALTDLASGKDKATVRRDLDNAIGDLLERAKFGAK
jgi:hypothetical protein